MAIPEIGLEDVPINPGNARGHSHKEEAEDHHQQCRQKVVQDQVLAPVMGKNVSMRPHEAA